MISYETIPEFDKDFKKLEKKYRTLSADFATMKRANIEALYIHNINNGSIVPIEGFCGDRYTSNKVRKFSCAALKGKGARSGIRVIFIWETELNKVTFIEIYVKSDKPNEDKKRLQQFIENSPNFSNY